MEGGRERARDRTSFARDKLSTFFYYYCASMEFIPARALTEWRARSFASDSDFEYDF